MEQGLPSVIRFGLPALEAALAAGHDCNKALVYALIALMAVVEDTTVVYRSGSLAALRAVQRKAGRLLESGVLETDTWEEAVRNLDAELVRETSAPAALRTC